MNAKELKKLRQKQLAGIKIPEHFKVVKVGEKIKELDMYWSENCKKWRTRDDTVGKYIESEDLITIRWCAGHKDKKRYPIRYQ